MTETPRQKAIRKAPVLPLSALPNICDESFQLYLEQLISKCDEVNAQRSRRSSYEKACSFVLCAIMEPSANFYRYEASTRVNVHTKIFYDDGITRTAVQRAIESAEKLGWIKRLDFLREVNPLIDGLKNARFEILNECPRFSSDTEVDFDLNNIDFVREYPNTKNIGTTEYAYSASDKSDDNERLLKYHQLLMSAQLKVSGSLVVLPKILMRKIQRRRSNSIANGRFDGGFWQTKSVEERSEITINDEPVCELDYSTMYLRGLYHLSGKSLTKDVYSSLADACVFSRSEIKIFISIAMNTSKRGWKQAAKGQAMSVDAGSFSEHFDVFKQQFQSECAEIYDQLFNPSIGAKLMWLESLVARKIISTLTGNNIVVLPIHDSFIVQQSNEEELRDVMIRSYADLFGFDPVIDKKY